MHDHNEPDSEIDHGKTGRPPMQPRAKATREAIIRAGLVLSIEPSLHDAYAIYEAWTEALTPIVIDAIRAGALDCAESMSRLADTLCAGFVGAVKVAASRGENDTITRRVDDLLMMWRGTDPVSVRMIEGASL